MRLEDPSNSMLAFKQAIGELMARNRNPTLSEICASLGRDCSTTKDKAFISNCRTKMNKEFFKGFVFYRKGMNFVTARYKIMTTKEDQYNEWRSGSLDHFIEPDILANIHDEDKYKNQFVNAQIYHDWTRQANGDNTYLLFCREGRYFQPNYWELMDVQRRLALRTGRGFRTELIRDYEYGIIMPDGEDAQEALSEVADMVNMLESAKPNRKAELCHACLESKVEVELSGQDEIAKHYLEAHRDLTLA